MLRTAKIAISLPKADLLRIEKVRKEDLDYMDCNIDCSVRIKSKVQCLIFLL